MMGDVIQRWLSEHPRALSVLFFVLLKTSEHSDLLPDGGSETFVGP